MIYPLRPNKIDQIKSPTLKTMSKIRSARTRLRHDQEFTSAKLPGHIQDPGAHACPSINNTQEKYKKSTSEVEWRIRGERKRERDEAYEKIQREINRKGHDET